MINTIIFVFIGGAVGAMLREFLMLATPNLADGFPTSIFVANIAASFMLGLVAALSLRQVLNEAANALLATGVMGGLSTFSSFIYGAYVIGSGGAGSVWVALVYLLASLVAGYMAVYAGFVLGGGRRAA